MNLILAGSSSYLRTCGRDFQVIGLFGPPFRSQYPVRWLSPFGGGCVGKGTLADRSESLVPLVPVVFSVLGGSEALEDIVLGVSRTGLRGGASSRTSSGNDSTSSKSCSVLGDDARGFPDCIASSHIEPNPK